MPRVKPRDDQRIRFRAEITLTADEINEAQGDLAQAVQNQIGPAGAVVIEVEDN